MDYFDTKQMLANYTQAISVVNYKYQPNITKMKLRFNKPVNKLDIILAHNRVIRLWQEYGGGITVAIQQNTLLEFNQGTKAVLEFDAKDSSEEQYRAGLNNKYSLILKVGIPTSEARILDLLIVALIRRIYTQNGIVPIDYVTEKISLDEIIGRLVILSFENIVKQSLPINIAAAIIKSKVVDYSNKDLSNGRDVLIKIDKYNKSLSIKKRQQLIKKIAQIKKLDCLFEDDLVTKIRPYNLKRDTKIKLNDESLNKAVRESAVKQFSSKTY